MKMTNAIRDKIVTNAVAKSGLNDVRDAIVKQRAEWAEKVRLDAIGGIEVDKRIEELRNQHAELMSSVPSVVRRDGGGIVRRDDDIWVNVAGISFCANYHGGVGYPDFKQVYKVSPSSHTLLADNPLVAEFHEIHNKQAEYDDKLSTLMNSVQAAVQKVTTVKKLLEVWPEAKELIPEEVEKQVKQLPAIKTEDLNKMIGLPS